jgi:hypothetical protein
MVSFMDPDLDDVVEIPTLIYDLQYQDSVAHDR